jgi:Zn finger protein HypA/HybF involved in hydrogenase expression
LYPLARAADGEPFAAARVLNLQTVFSVSLSVGALVYTFSALSFVLGLWFYYDFRDRGMYDRERRKAIFHCIRCDKLYAARVGTETCPCPKCSFRNSRLRF